MLDVALCNCRFIANSKHRLDFELELVKVAYLDVNIVRSVALVILLDKRFNLSKSLSTHITRNKRNMFFFRHLFFLKYKKKVLLYKLIIKLYAVSTVEIRLVNINIVSLNSIRHVNVRVIRAARGSTCF